MSSITELLRASLVARAKMKGAEAHSREVSEAMLPILNQWPGMHVRMTDEQRDAFDRMYRAGRAADVARQDARDADHRLLAAIVGDAPRIEGDEPAGLHPKYLVLRNDGSSRVGGKHCECDYLVLDWTHDKFAVVAALAYADACEDAYPELAADIRARAAEARRQ